MSEISKWMWIPADEEEDIMWCMPPEEGTGEKLTWMQDKVDGYIERLPPHMTELEPLWLSCGFDIPTISNFKQIENVWVNEEGLLRGLPVNNRASGIYREYFDEDHLFTIVGDVLIEFKGGEDSEE